MPSNDIDNAKATIENIFLEVSTELEKVIDQYRLILIEYPDDLMSDQTFAFIDELEGLKKKINNKQLKLADRIESTGNVAEYIADLIHDEDEERLETTNKFDDFTDKIESEIGIDEDSVGFNQENDQANAEGVTREIYFRGKQDELTKLMTMYPELNN